MKYEVETQKGAVKAVFTLTDAEWQDELTASYNRTKGKYNVPGFRKGHATRKMIEAMYGAGVFFDDAFDSAFRRCYREFLSKETEVRPVDEPQVDFVPTEKGISFSATVTVKPEVVLGAYKGMKVGKVAYNVTDADVEHEIEHAVERASREVSVERAVENGDKVTLDYSGSIDGVKFDGGTAQNQQLVIGSNTFIPGFEEQMIGMNKGEEKDLSVKFPDDYHAKDMAGKNAVFHVKVHDITVKEKPAVDDAFAKEVSEFDTLEAYRKSIREKLEKQNKDRADRENENALLEEIVKNVTVDIPECMIRDELEYMLRDFEYRIQSMYGGMKLADYFKYTGTTEEDFKKQRRESALNTVKLRLSLEAIIKAENLEVTDADTDALIKEIAESRGQDFETYKKEVSEREMPYIKSDALMKKVVDFLKANNTFVLKEKEEEKKPAKKTAGETAKKTTGETTKKTTGGTAKKKTTKKAEDANA